MNMAFTYVAFIHYDKLIVGDRRDVFQMRVFVFRNHILEYSLAWRSRDIDANELVLRGILVRQDIKCCPIVSDAVTYQYLHEIQNS